MSLSQNFGSGKFPRYTEIHFSYIVIDVMENDSISNSGWLLTLVVSTDGTLLNKVEKAPMFIAARIYGTAGPSNTKVSNRTLTTKWMILMTC